MRLRNAKSRTPVWHDIAPGVRWQVRSLPPEVQLAAQSQTAEAMYNIRLGRMTLAEYGYADEDFGLLKDPNVLVGLGLLVGACAWAEAALVAWEGMQDENGADLPLSPEAIRAALRHDDETAGPIFLNAALAIRDGGAKPSLVPGGQTEGEP